MIALSIEEAIKKGRSKNIDSTFGHNLYIIRNGEDVFYVGQTRKIATVRLLQHLGIDGVWNNVSSIGAMIRDNLPESLKWSFCLYTYQDCDDLVFKHILEKKYAGTIFTKEWYLGMAREELRIDFSEEALIEEHKPYLNVMMAVPTKDIPATYLQEIDSSSRFLPSF